MNIRNALRKFLGFQPIETEATIAPARRSISHMHRQLIEKPQRTFFELIDAQNGKILVFTEHTENPHGPDKNISTVFIVQDNENIMDYIQKALVMSKLK